MPGPSGARQIPEQRRQLKDVIWSCWPACSAPSPEQPDLPFRASTSNVSHALGIRMSDGLFRKARFCLRRTCFSITTVSVRRVLLPGSEPNKADGSRSASGRQGES